MPRLERVFGLSINEEIQWGTALADLEAGVMHEGYESDILCPIPAGKLPLKPEDTLFLEQAIADGLNDLHRKRPDIFEETVRIGISCIGVINRQDRVLVSIARKGWVTERNRKGKRPFLVDFKYLCLGGQGKPKLFPRVTHIDQIIAQNDASARCLTEYIYGFDKKTRPKSLLYLMAGEGVNGSIVLSGDFPSMIGHPEFGHCTPQLHPHDKFFDPKNSGCPAHSFCFEGLVSGARFRQEWGRELGQLPSDHQAWDIAAFYLSQMAMTGTLMLEPERIIFGGEIFYGPKGLSLIERTQDIFLQLNAGYLPQLDTLAAVKRLIGRATYGKRVWVMSALTMASSPGHASTKAVVSENPPPELPVFPTLHAAQIAENADNVIQLRGHTVRNKVEQ